MYNDNRLVSFKSASSAAVYFRTFFLYRKHEKMFIILSLCIKPDTIIKDNTLSQTNIAKMPMIVRDGKYLLPKSEEK